jgi:hypothetical protein
VKASSVSTTLLQIQLSEEKDRMSEENDQDKSMITLE